MKYKQYLVMKECNYEAQSRLNTSENEVIRTQQKVKV